MTAYLLTHVPRNFKAEAAERFDAICDDAEKTAAVTAAQGMRAKCGPLDTAECG
jgi:hypothetical protein